MQIPLDRLLLETDCPDGLPSVADAALARKLEAAAGSSLRVLPAPDCKPPAEDRAAPDHCRGGGGSGDAGTCGSDGDSMQAGAGYGAAMLLDWRCPLRFQAPNGSIVLAGHPSQLLNQPANIR